MHDVLDVPIAPALRVPAPRGLWQRSPHEGFRSVDSRIVDSVIDMRPGELIWRRVFRGLPDQVPVARHFVRFLLADSPRRDDAELIVSELCGNAIWHTSSAEDQGTFTVEVARTAEAVDIAVYDAGGWGGIPSFTLDRDTSAGSGRGLAIVARLASTVGFEGCEERGYRVWARLLADEA
jgi:serine/threonine-protein kinase RsbW